MCAATPTTPVVVTLPLTALSSPTTMVPVPEADVFTGGTSWAPLSATLTCWLHDGPGHATRTAAAATAPRATAAMRLRRFMDLPPSGGLWDSLIVGFL